MTLGQFGGEAPLLLQLVTTSPGTASLPEKGTGEVTGTLGNIYCKQIHGKTPFTSNRRLSVSPQVFRKVNVQNKE